MILPAVNKIASTNTSTFNFLLRKSGAAQSFVINHQYSGISGD